MQRTCPIPISDYPVVTLAHGGGGRLMRMLIEKMFGAAFSNPLLDRMHDSASLTLPGGPTAFTTDSFVVRPLAFPGGNIGELAVYGTVNDLLMAGAEPRYLSCGMILEEGLPMEELWTIVTAMREAADRAGVSIVTGDTKVVDRGKGDGVYINTSGIGSIPAGRSVGPDRIAPGDAVIVNGDLGRHGIAIMAVREGLEFESEITSDCAPLHREVDALFKAGIDVHCMRDCTRGGLASSVIELAGQSGRGIRLDEAVMPVREDVRGACEMLGLDPMYVANEGRFVLFVPGGEADRACECIKAHGPEDAIPVVIGHVEDNTSGEVTLRSRIGADRLLDLLSGEQLPRIC